MKIGIIGGGISGLSLAYFIKRFNPVSHITLFDKSNKLGGSLNHLPYLQSSYIQANQYSIPLLKILDSF